MAETQQCFFNQQLVCHWNGRGLKGCCVCVFTSCGGHEFRQSMDMYASPAISIFSPSLNRISSSYLSSSYQRTRHSPHITQPLLADTTESQQQQIPFLPGRLEKGERHPEGYYATRADEHAKKKTDADYTTKVKAREGSSVLQALLNGRFFEW